MKMEEMRLKKKWVAVLLTVTLIGGLTACGPKEAELAEKPVEEALEEVVEDTAAEVVKEEEAPAEEVTTEESTSDNVAEEVTPVETELTGEQAMEKVKRMFDAYQDLMISNNDVNFIIEDRCETFSNISDIGVTTSDGVLLINTEKEFTLDGWYGVYVSWAVGQNYYYDYVNNNGSCYDFEKYITTHTADEILYKYNDKDVISNSDSLGNDYLMIHGIFSTPYLINHDITANELITGDGVTSIAVNGKSIAYELPLLVDGKESGFVAVFDEDRNLLNINIDKVPDDWEPVYSFDSNHQLIN